MPIYEYECRACGEAFELLVLRSETPTCPSCAATDVERRFSAPAVSSDGTRQRKLAGAKAKNRSVRQERTAADHDAMRHYREEH